MGNDIRNTNSVESMLDILFDRTAETEQKMACCSCLIDNKKYIVAMDISNAPYLILLIFNTENEQHFILKTEEDWDDVVKKVCGFLDCSDKNELTVSDFGSYWYSRLEPDSSIITEEIELEPDSSIVTEAIEQKRKFFICSYPETFEDHYDPCDENGRSVLLITEFSDDFKQVHFYVHFENTDEAFHLSEATDTPDLVRNLYCELCDYEENLQIKEREELNRFYPQNKYDAADYAQVKSLFLKAISNAFKSDIGIYSFRFRTDAGSYAAEIIAVSSELNEVRVIIHNIDTKQNFTRTFSGRKFFEEIFTVDLFIALFPEEAKEIYNRESFDPEFDTTRQEITEILDKASKEGSAGCSFYGVNKDIPELGAEYSADAVLEKDSNQIRLTVKDTFKENVSYECTVEVGMPYDGLFSGLYQFLYPKRIALSIEDIRKSYN
ncbi:MAG: hypothetical protein ACI4J2_01560 [Ruminococcus sp.]